MGMSTDVTEVSASSSLARRWKDCAQLCHGCRELFSGTSKLTYKGADSPWLPIPSLSRPNDCHLCALAAVGSSTLAKSPWPVGKGISSPRGTHHAFTVLNEDWVCFGQGSPWPSPKVDYSIWDEEELPRYLRFKMYEDPTDYQLGKLLASDSDELLDNPTREFFLVLRLNWAILPLEPCLREIPESEAIALRHVKSHVSTSTSGWGNTELAKHWLRNCVENHPGCRPSAQSSESNWLPTRLLHLGVDGEGNGTVRLLTTGDLDEQGRENISYAALSHRWGHKKDFVATSVNIRDYQAAVPVVTLSTTLQDAIQACRDLGFAYLWIDCLCIIQDDHADWARESVTMSQVYGFATCTIAAANSKHSSSDDGGDGLFSGRNPLHVRPCLVPNPFDPSSDRKFLVRPSYLLDIYDAEVRQSEWYSRGWVFQERTLSHRMLIFGRTQMLWACQEVQCAESWPDGQSSDYFINQFDSFNTDKARFRRLMDPTRYVGADDSLWPTFIADYTRAGLTHGSDRLVALQGIASSIEAATGSPYAAGLWLDGTLPMSLLWTTKTPGLARPRDYRAPSWSWASVDGSVVFNSDCYKGSGVIRNVRLVTLSHCLSVHTQYPVLGLQLSGCLLEAVVVTDPDGTGTLISSSWWRRMTRATTIIEGSIASGLKITETLGDTSGKGVLVFLQVMRHFLRACWTRYQEYLKWYRQAADTLSARLLAVWHAVWTPAIAMVVMSTLYVVGCPLIFLVQLMGLPTARKWVSGLITRWREARQARDPRVRLKLADFVPDVPLRREDRGLVYLVPILDQYQTYGLVVQPFPGLPNTYERIGVFEGHGQKLSAIYSPSRGPVPQAFTLL